MSRSFDAPFVDSNEADILSNALRKGEKMTREKDELARLQKQHRLRTLRRVASPTSTTIELEGKKVLLFCSNNYLGLANHPLLKKAAISAVETWGVGSGASRLISGSLHLNQKLEEKLAQLKCTEAALVFNSGYTTNLGVLSAIIQKGDLILADRLNHASLIDGCRLSRGTFRVYRHKDMAQLEKLLKQRKTSQQTFIVTDGLFSMDGDIAPLPELVDLAERYDATIYLDDAHATGVLGEHGGGSLDHFQVASPRIIQMGTLSKALGGLGGFICGRRSLIDYLVNKARPFIYTTALPPSVLATGLAALDLIEKEPQIREQLWKNRAYFHKKLRALGFDTFESETPIIPIRVGESDKALAFSEYLLDHGLFVQAIRPPTVPEGTARLRVTLMATHSLEEMDTLLTQLEAGGKALGVL